MVKVFDTAFLLSGGQLLTTGQEAFSLGRKGAYSADKAMGSFCWGVQQVCSLRSFLKISGSPSTKSQEKKTLVQLTSSGSPSSSEVVLTTVTCGLASSGGPGSLSPFSLSILSPGAESALHSSEVDENLDSKAVVEVREKRGRNI